MCGINGVTERNEGLVERMNDATKHRGPDANGVWTNGRVTLGSNRLAIIDLSESANQPMQTADGKYTIVFNGEIYNYRELRAELEGWSKFRTKSDTEVILALYEKIGVETFARLNGMFAIAIWDSKKNELVLARDHSGIKPLYYHIDDDRLVFSSELKGILTDSRVERSINPDALERYLRLRYVPGEDALIRGVHKLPAASFGVFRRGQFTINHFFRTPASTLNHSATDASARVRELIDASVQRQLVSDRPLGIFLSGGLDSSIVLDSATRAGGRMQTFSLGFELQEHEQPEKFNADSVLAKKTAEHYGARHHEVKLSENEFVDLLPEVIHYLDQPIANATAVAQYALAKFAREHVVVALEGDGGDELFGGYPRYRLNNLMNWYQKFPGHSALAMLAHKLQKLDTPQGIGRIELFHFEKDRLLERAVHSAFISARPREWFEARYMVGEKSDDFTRLLMDVDRRSWLVDESLSRTDTMTMGASLEARVPLLDPELIEYASQLPSSSRVGFSANKRLLRTAFKDRLPAHVLKAGKRGFFSPTAKWLRRPLLHRMAREVLSRGYHAGTDSVVSDRAIALLEQHGQGAYAPNVLWSLIVFRLWAREFDVRL